MSGTESVESESPRVWIESLLASREEVSGLLDEAKHLYLRGKKNELKELLNGLLTADPAIYRAAMYSIGGGEDFFADVEEQMSEETVRKIEEWGQNYTLLFSEMTAIFNENTNDTKNTITGGIVSQKYDPESQTPLLTLKFVSGDTTLLETRNSIGRMIYLSDLVLQGAVSGLETTTERKLSINPEEIELIKDQINDLNRSISLTEELFEEQRLRTVQNNDQQDE